MDDHNLFDMVLRAFSAFVDVQSRNILLCVSTVGPIISAECKICALSTELDRHGTSAWFGYG